MARKLSGDLQGKARQTELRDRREFLEEDRARVVAELREENDAIRRCVVLEGEQSFYQWWDDDTHVPPTATRKERTELIEMRIRFLSTPMDKHEESVTNEEADGRKSQQEAES